MRAEKILQSVDFKKVYEGPAGFERLAAQRAFLIERYNKG